MIATQALEAALNHATEHREANLQQLLAFLRIPSISTQPEHSADVATAAHWLAEAMRHAGLENVRLIETEGHPLVYGDHLHAGPDAPTILIYGHYDVQPPEPLELWESPPFELTRRGNRLYARGISDDNYTEITSGLQENEELVIGGYKAISKDLDDGKLIKILSDGE